MRRYYFIFLALGLLACKHDSKTDLNNRTGSFSGIFKKGDFSDNIIFEIERDSNDLKVYFTSLAQNANRIPVQNIELQEDSINFKLQSDFYTYLFKNKWIDNYYTSLEGTLIVDTVTTKYTFKKNDLLSKNY